jgi:hypothetical protein
MEGCAGIRNGQGTAILDRNNLREISRPHFGDTHARGNTTSFGLELWADAYVSEHRFA